MIIFMQTRQWHWNTHYNILSTTADNFPFVIIFHISASLNYLPFWKPKEKIQFTCIYKCSYFLWDTLVPWPTKILDNVSTPWGQLTGLNFDHGALVLNRSWENVRANMDHRKVAYSKRGIHAVLDYSPQSPYNCCYPQISLPWSKRRKETKDLKITCL